MAIMIYIEKILKLDFNYENFESVLQKGMKGWTDVMKNKNYFRYCCDTEIRRINLEFDNKGDKFSLTVNVDDSKKSYVRKDIEDFVDELKKVLLIV